MNWIKDKKNAPIVIGLLVLFAVGAIFFSLYEMGVIGGSSVPDETASAPPPPVTPVPGASTPSVSGVPGTPSASGVPGSPLSPNSGPPATSGKTVIASIPTSLTTKDPFRLPVTSQQKNVRNKLTAELTRQLVTPLSIASYKSTDRLQASPSHAVNAPQTNPNQRVSGILYNNGVYAILETSGVSEAVRPGQSVDGGRVVSIQPDGLTLVTDDNQTVKVPLQPGVPGGGTGGGFTGGSYSGGGGFPGRPGGFGPGRGFGGGGGAGISD